MKPQVLVEHTSHVSRRRRALFPSEEVTDPDLLGCITPLKFDDENCVNVSEKVFSLNVCDVVEDYNIIGLMVKEGSVCTPNNSVTASSCTNSTPTNNESPTHSLKTPNDLSDNSKFPKLTRSKVHDTVFNSDTNKNPKVRTALFPELTMYVPTKTFYPKKHSATHKNFVSPRKESPRKIKKKRSLYICKRKNRFRTGEINAGVRHKIKKRKIKRISKAMALKAALNIIENSPLNGFLSEPSPESLTPPSPSPPPRDPTPSPDPDPNKKFFKSSRHKATITVHSNIKLEMNKGRISLIPNTKQIKGVKRPHRPDESNTKKIKLCDFDNEEPMLSGNQVTNIISALEEKGNKGVINNTENVTGDCAADVLMSPTSQMCNMTSGLALNSPKKARDLTQVLDKLPSEKKLFPLFYPGKRTMPTKNESSKNIPIKKFKGVSKDQMLLDAGQKRWGATQCPECKIVYHQGDPGDEIMHLNYHNAGHIFRFNGWKNERVVSNSTIEGRIIQIAPDDPKIWWKKVKDVMEVVNRDLGFYEMEFNTVNSQIFFYIKNKTIIGALVAEVKTSAHKLLTTSKDQVDLCSEESYPIKCGISRIWVSNNHRKKGVATLLMESLKRNFMYGYILTNADIAFSSPTEMGKLFGLKYFNNPNFLIYFV